MSTYRQGARSPLLHLSHPRQQIKLPLPLLVKQFPLPLLHWLWSRSTITRSWRSCLATNICSNSDACSQISAHVSWESNALLESGKEREMTFHISHAHLICGTYNCFWLGAELPRPTSRSYVCWWFYQYSREHRKILQQQLRRQLVVESNENDPSCLVQIF